MTPFFKPDGTIKANQGGKFHRLLKRCGFRPTDVTQNSQSGHFTVTFNAPDFRATVPPAAAYADQLAAILGETIRVVKTHDTQCAAFNPMWRADDNLSAAVTLQLVSEPDEEHIMRRWQKSKNVERRTYAGGLADRQREFHRLAAQYPRPTGVFAIGAEVFVPGIPFPQTAIVTEITEHGYKTTLGPYMEAILRQQNPVYQFNGVEMMYKPQKGDFIRNIRIDETGHITKVNATRVEGVDANGETFNWSISDIRPVPPAAENPAAAPAEPMTIDKLAAASSSSPRPVDHPIDDSPRPEGEGLGERATHTEPDGADDSPTIERAYGVPTGVDWLPIALRQRAADQRIARVTAALDPDQPDDEDLIEDEPQPASVGTVPGIHETGTTNTQPPTIKFLYFDPEDADQLASYETIANQRDHDGWDIISVSQNKTSGKMFIILHRHIESVRWNEPPRARATAMAPVPYPGDDPFRQSDRIIENPYLSADAKIEALDRVRRQSFVRTANNIYSGAQS